MMFTLNVVWLIVSVVGGVILCAVYCEEPDTPIYILWLAIAFGMSAVFLIYTIAFLGERNMLILEYVWFAVATFLAVALIASYLERPTPKYILWLGLGSGLSAVCLVVTMLFLN